jgi:murein tripeptide amidase MpaA
MLQGVLDKLMNFENVHTKILLNNYIFKVIPMLNPDGVSRGYWRFDTLG